MFRIISLFALSIWAGAAPLQSPLDPDSHCVAYEVRKVTAFVSESPVIGKNCEVSAQVLPEVGGLYHVEVNIPLRGFSSGNADRDQDVMELLKAKQKPELTFRSEAMSVDQWHELFAKTDFDIKGELTVGDRAFPLILHSHYIPKESSADIDGTADVKFADFDMHPPRVALGLIAKAKSDFKLFFHLQSQRILGADSIRLGSQER